LQDTAQIFGDEGDGNANGTVQQGHKLGNPSQARVGCLLETTWLIWKEKQTKLVHLISLDMKATYDKKILNGNGSQ
jgi:hypothetical protein